MASFKDLQPKQLKVRPFDNIGAQDLCSLEVNWKGFLRKEGKLERGLKKFAPKQNAIHWRRYFVVLSQGCVYVFNDENSTSPKLNFALGQYHRVQRNFDVPCSFDILPLLGDAKVYRFQCTSDNERLEWMRAVYVSLLCVHKLPIPSQKFHKRPDEYKLIESDVKAGPSSVSDDVYEIKDSDSDDYKYDEIDEDAVDAARPKNKYERDPTFKHKLPPVPHQAKFKEAYDDAESAMSGTSSPSSISRSRSLHLTSGTPNEEVNISSTIPGQKPQIAANPKLSGGARYINSAEKCNKIKTSPGSQQPDKCDPLYINSDKQEHAYIEPDPDPTYEYMFDGNRENSARVMEPMPSRTFLVRDSSEADKKVLVVKTSKDSLKSFKIGKKDGKFLIELGAEFDDVDRLIQHYKKRVLPNIGITLHLGYRAAQRKAKGPDDDDYEPVAERRDQNVYP